MKVREASRAGYAQSGTLALASVTQRKARERNGNVPEGQPHVFPKTTAVSGQARHAAMPLLGAMEREPHGVHSVEAAAEAARPGTSERRVRFIWLTAAAQNRIEC